MLWAAKVTSTTPTVLTEGTTDTLIITNAVIANLETCPQARFHLKVNNQKFEICRLNRHTPQRQLDIQLDLKSKPELLVSKGAEVHLLGYFMPSELEVEDQGDEEEEEVSEDRELDQIRKKKK